MILQKLKSKIREKKGAGAIEFTMNMMIFLLVLSLGFELIMISVKYMQVSNYANDLVRTLAVQGGVDRTTPAGFQGGSSSYKNISQLINEKNSFARSVGVSPSDLEVRITTTSSSGREVTTNIESRTPIRIDYLETFEVNIDYRPRLEVTHNFGAVLNTILRKTKVGISEYVYNYDQ